MRLGVDALNLVADRRGMGRFARTVLGGLQSSPDVEVTLLVRDPAHAEVLRAEFPFEVRTLLELRAARLHCTWYPWNGVRFDARSSKIVTVHDAFAFTHPHPNLVARWREQLPIRRALCAANVLTTVSRWSAREIARVVSVDEARFTIVNPVPDAFWRPVLPERAGKPYILVVGGPDRRKNLPLFFRAFERAFPDGGVMLVVAGTLHAEDETALRATRVAYERVRPNDEKLRELYGGALAVAVPSLYEGYGLMCVEAMACGAAVVAADSAALPEACDGAALLVAPIDMQAWSASLRRIAEDDALRTALRRQSLARSERIDRAAPARVIAALARRCSAAVR